MDFYISFSRVLKCTDILVPLEMKVKAETADQFLFRFECRGFTQLSVESCRSPPQKVPPDSHAEQMSW